MVMTSVPSPKPQCLFLTFCSLLPLDRSSPAWTIHPQPVAALDAHDPTPRGRHRNWEHTILMGMGPAHDFRSWPLLLVLVLVLLLLAMVPHAARPVAPAFHHPCSSSLRRRGTASRRLGTSPAATPARVPGLIMASTSKARDQKQGEKGARPRRAQVGIYGARAGDDGRSGAGQVDRGWDGWIAHDVNLSIAHGVHAHLVAPHTKPTRTETGGPREDGP